MDCLVTKIEELTESLSNLKFGSEEFSNGCEAIKHLTEANSNVVKANNDTKYREEELRLTKIGIIVNCFGIGATFTNAAMATIFKRITNKQALSYEVNDVITTRVADVKA